MSELHFDADIDIKKIEQGARKIDSELNEIAKRAANSGSIMDNAFKKSGQSVDDFSKKTINAGNAMASIGALVSLTMLSQFGKEILDTTAKFEKFGIVLRNTLGDTEGGEALNMIANFAATTPFQLDEVTGAFIKMANQGFVPTRKEMVKLGDVASSTGKSFDQLVEGILDAQTGQFERLNEFGIKASSSGDKVTFSFKEQQTTVENTNSAIRGYILSLGELKGISGANEKISASLTGQISNMGDKIAAMYNKIGSENQGILYGAVGTASTLIDNYETIADALKGLILVYGAHKVAVMAVAYQENAKAAIIARNIAIEAEYTALLATQNTLQRGRAAQAVAEAAIRVTATNTVIAAEQKLAATTKASSLTNTYVLAAMAVAALGYAIYKVVSHQSELEKAIKKVNVETENEKDKAAQLFAELKNATAGTDGWKKAKQGILDQYGSYLTEQQKELTGINLIAEAYKNVNRGIEENIALKVKQESLDAISQKFNDKIVTANEGIQDAVKDKLGRDRAAEVGQVIAPLIANVKIAVDKESRDKATKELQDYLQNLAKETKGNSKILDFDPDVMRFRGDLFVALKGFSDESMAINKAFEVQAKKIAEGKTDPVLTTYQAQIEAIKAKKAIAEKELAALKTTPRVNPMKDIQAKQSEIDEYNKQLGIKEKESAKAVTGAYEQIEAAIKKTSDAVINASENERPALQEKLSALVKQKQAWEDLIKAQRGETKDLKPLSIKTPAIEVSQVKEQLKPMKQLTEEQKKQLEVKSKQLSLDAVAKENWEQQIDLIQQSVSFLDESISKYGEMLGLSEDQQKALENGMNAMKGMVQIASGNVIQGAFTLVASLADTLISKPEKISEIFEGINEGVQKVITSLDTAGETFANLNKDASATALRVIKAQLLDLADSAKLLNDELSQSSTGRRRSVDMGLPNIVKQATEINLEIEKLTNRLLRGDISDEQRKSIELILDSYNSLLAKIDSTIQDITGTTVSDFSRSLSDAILDGVDAWDAWGQKANDVIKNVISKQLSAKLLNAPITDAVNSLVNDSTDGLTADESKKFQDAIKSIYESVVPIYEATVNSMKGVGIDLGSNTPNASTPLTGISAQMTEETGTLVAGQMMGMRVDIKSLQETSMNQLELMDLSLSALNQIAKNTSHNVMLNDIAAGVNETNKILREKL